MHILEDKGILIICLNSRMTAHGGYEHESKQISEYVQSSLNE